MAAWVLIFWLGGYTSPAVVDMPSGEVCRVALQKMVSEFGEGRVRLSYCMDRSAPNG